MNDSANLTSIIIALIAIMSMIITIFGGAVVYFGKWFSKSYGKDMQAHTKSAIEAANASTRVGQFIDEASESRTALSVAVEKNTQSNQEIIKFMTNLNGKLAKATILTAQEQANNTHAVQDNTAAVDKNTSVLGV